MKIIFKIPRVRKRIPKIQHIMFLVGDVVVIIPNCPIILW